jgi:tetratricopeptide (TPR) repeat protein
MGRTLHLAIAIFFAASAFSVFGQSAEESAARSAEQAGKLREAFAQYVAAVQKTAEGSGDERRLQEVIVRLVPRLSPTPAIPEDARRFGVRGRAWMKEAKSEADYTEAAREFAKALRIAPWWAEGYINHGVALEKAGRYSDAAQNLKMYLLASPSAPDAGKVKDHIYTLEVRQEKSQRNALEARKRREDEARATEPNRVAGEWCSIFGGRKKNCSPDVWGLVRIVVNGENIEVWGSYATGGHRAMMRGRINGAKIIGLYFVRPEPDGSDVGCPMAELPMEADISSDGKRIVVAFEHLRSYMGCRVTKTERASVTWERR